MSEKRFVLYEHKGDYYILKNPRLHLDFIEMLGDALTSEEIVEELNQLDDKVVELAEENEQLRQMIKENVFQRYSEGSLADLEFKAIAYDDIIKVKLSDDSEPKVIVYCNYGKRKNVVSFCQMFIPFGIGYEIKEVIE